MLELLPDRDALKRGFEEHEILNSASAIAFQVLFAMIPIVLTVLALLGFLNLEDVWSDAARDLRPNVSEPVFEVIDGSVRRVLGERQPFWLTAGAVLAAWRLSAAMRSVMGALDRIYGARRDRPLVERIGLSLGLAVAVTALFLGALAMVRVLPLLVEEPDSALGVMFTIARWCVAALLLLLAVGLTIRYAPAVRQPVEWVSFGSAVCVACWVVASAGFGFYVTHIASYGSIFGSFATLFVLLTYLYLSTTALLLGAEIDAQVRREAEGSRSGR